jgi:alpha-tubulin suppressor-like RCC1 family protein
MSDRGERLELQVSDIDDPLPDATFGSIGRYVEVAWPDQPDDPLVPHLLTLGFDERRAEHVDLWTLMLFRVDRESREFTPVESSRVDVDKRQVTAWVDQPGTYGLIGLPKHLGVLETLRLLNRLSPQLLEERERGERGLQDRICGLILCADPTAWDSAPTAPGDLCQKCLGLDVSGGRLPEKYLLERKPYIPPFREIVADQQPPGGPSLVAWGSNDSGELGDGSTTTRTTPVWVVPAFAAKKVVGTVGNGEWTLALATDGTVWAWGRNWFGALGDGTFVDHRSVPGRVGLLDNVVDIAAGQHHGVAVRADGSVWKWGLDERYTTMNPNRLPVWAGLNNIVAVAAGLEHTLALRNDGRVFAWGGNSLGELGDGTFADSENPVLVPGLTAVRSIAAGWGTSFAIKSNGTVFAWGSVRDLVSGSNTWNQPSVVTPMPVPGLSNVEQISAREEHALAQTTAGEVWFWGLGVSGDGTSERLYTTPVQVPGLPPITDIAVGESHSLAMAGDGTVWAWGDGSSGQIGINPVHMQLKPASVPLPQARHAAGVAAGRLWSLATLS